MYTLQAEKQRVPWSTILAGMVGVALVLSVVIFSVFSTELPNQVTLHTATGGGWVRVYDDISVDSARIKEFPDGTRCQKVSGPIHAIIDGVKMELMEVVCQGTHGHVNAKWVDD